MTKKNDKGVVVESRRFVYNESSQLVESMICDGRKVLKWCYTYDADGNLIRECINEYTYNGESYNPNIHSQYLRARYYNVVTADFLTQDSYLGTILEPLTLNRYSYCVGNPVNFRDPSGHVIAAVPGLIVGGIVGFVLGVGSEVAQGISSIANGEDYNWGKGALHIVNATLTGGITGGALGATLNPVAAGIAGGAVGAGLNAWTDSLFVKETSLNEKAVRALEKAFIGGAAGGAAVLTGYVAGIFLSGISTGNAYVNAVLPYANTLLSGAAAAVGYGDVYRKLDGQQNTLKNAAVDAVFGAAAAGIGITVNASVEYFMARGAHQTDLWKAQEEAVRLSRNKSCDDGLDETEAFYDRIFEQQRMVNAEYEEYLQELQKVQGEGSLGKGGSGAKETELFLPDEAYNKQLPKFVTPGTKNLPKYDEFGNLKQIKYYDDYGREIGWVDFTNHGYPDNHTVPHWHEV